MSCLAKAASLARARGAIVAATAGCALLAACSTSVTYGTDPNVAALDQLVLGQTTEAEIRQIVGPPRGRGGARWSLAADRWDMLFYEIAHAEGKEVDLKMLLILVKDGRYDGHLWFSSFDVPIGGV